MDLAAPLGCGMNNAPFLAPALLLSSLASAATHYVTLAGLGGEKEYEQRFAGMARDIDKILAGSGGENRVHTLAGADATKEKVSALLGDIARAASQNDEFVLILIGHGSFDGQEYKFNIPGPDLSAAELAALCDRIAASRQLIVNTTSSSGGSIAFFQKPGRAVVAATKTGSEKNATIFSRYWVEAMRDAAADTDKNEVISALEAYRYADRRTTGFYETQKRLATEHAVLEDTGKGEAVRVPSAENGQGLLAGRFALVRIGSAQRAAADPAKRGLLEKKEILEREIDKLKYEKAAMPYETYRKRLSELLLELARTQEELEK